MVSRQSWAFLTDFPRLTFSQGCHLVRIKTFEAQTLNNYISVYHMEIREVNKCK